MSKDRELGSFFDDFAELEADLAKNPRKEKLQQATIIPNQPLTDESWEDLLNVLERTTPVNDVPPINTVFEAEKVGIPEITNNIPVSFFDEFFIEEKEDNPFVKKDPTYLVRINKQSAKTKLIEYYRSLLNPMMPNGALFKKRGLLGLTEPEKRALVHSLGLPEGREYEDGQLIEAGKRLIMSELGLFQKDEFGLSEFFDLAVKSDRIFNPSAFVSSTVSGFSKERLIEYFQIPRFVGDSNVTFNFVMMTPDQRAIWIINKYPLLANVKAQLINDFYLDKRKKYTLEYIKIIADWNDNQGRPKSGVISLKALGYFDSLPIYEEIFSVDDVLRFLLMPKFGRAKWIELQKK